METLENENHSGAAAFGSLTVGAPTKVQDKNENASNSDASGDTKRGNDIDEMFKKGTFRKKQGIVKEGRQTKFYHDDSDSTPMDVVD